MKQSKGYYLSKKYANMTFEDFWKEYKDDLNKNKKEEYDKASKFKRFFMNDRFEILEYHYIKVIAKHFFDSGRLQMVSEQNLALIEK